MKWRYVHHLLADSFSLSLFRSCPRSMVAPLIDLILDNM